jgi:general secretion pathway protein J
MKQSVGFSLVELLIALAILAILMGVTFQSVQLLIESDRNMKDQQVTLQNIQRAFMYMERDLRQIVPRPVNDGFAQQAAITTQANNNLLEFTKGGNPDLGWQLRKTGQMRSSLQRVAYKLEGKNLIRSTWSLVDHASQEKPVTEVLLPRIKAIKIEFKQVGTEEWNAEPSNTELPQAIAINLQHEFFGDIRRIFPVYIR